MSMELTIVTNQLSVVVVHAVVDCEVVVVVAVQLRVLLIIMVVIRHVSPVFETLLALQEKLGLLVLDCCLLDLVL